VAQTPQERPLDPQVLAWDRGPDKIDVSRYPAEVKKNYKVFAEICGQCHPLARAVNCDFALEDDWERYIKKMMRRGRSLVTPSQAEAAFEFAIYDSKIRKRDLYEKKLKLKQQQGGH
jgi:thiamine pyrophosphate-dependent acetolactate synthase large subunit-like protein